MNIYPAIDLRGGQCVRLLKGDFSKETVYGKDPGAMAKKWASEGAASIHVVDLDGALAGESRNLPSIKSIIKEGGIPIEVGGGIRTMEQIEKLLNLGVHQAILGSAAVYHPELVAEACKAFPGHIVVGIDAKEGMVAVEGWSQSGNIKAVELEKKMADCGVTRIIYTDIARDGMMIGNNIKETVEVAKACGIPVTASGGVSTLDDVRRLKKESADGIEGCIIGKALYTGAISLPDAVRIAKED
ncbi:MAG: 1-(5-phosphoribosyl)-5-[(5-phosphoribosylamino)methylideneamino]imidazole-4-carboxamide isomerase [Acidaminococcus sp.]|jgi:phosphoribosylformimino-5-aminoimidazole carboxamide ribotide isomerase|nr:1-(5-phosphoribosyl)-5-[(5-phosphoribosylamino)methylideneamino]imidazole-4-carboxamide isomerase [Acidaminococcus sp.]MCI2116431.1 1-(5-phosphoribosyl)-5-[(5-phosphoribosylamino)methylideneamino]imidazole-4-carboxamide isomerase [Acidaminococcus sp.]